MVSLCNSTPSTKGGGTGYYNPPHNHTYPKKYSYKDQEGRKKKEIDDRRHRLSRASFG
jgi:hypothetical protein